MDAEFVVRQLLNGLSLAVFLTLIALGLSVIFGLMGILNMAHGEFFILGAYSVFWTTSAGATFWLAIPAATVMVGLFGLLVYTGLIRFIYRSLTATILATWGLSIVIRQALRIGVGPQPELVRDPFSRAIHVVFFDYPAYRLFIIVVGTAIVASTIWLYFRTRLGLELRAAIHNREMASALGINTHRVSMLSFVVGSSLAGLAGALLSPLIPIEPLTGLNFLVDSFFVILVGGVGSVVGTALGGLVIGGGESVLQFGVSAFHAELLTLVVAMILIIIRPQGLVRIR